MPPSRVDIAAQQIGKEIRAERHRQRLDQHTLALVANVGVRSVHRVETGEPTVRLDVLLRIAHALGMEVDVSRGGNR